VRRHWRAIVPAATPLGFRLNCSCKLSPLFVAVRPVRSG
jgi:hypothetical protein